MTHDAIAVLEQRYGEWISTRWIDRLALSRDASLYRMVPQAVARPRSSQDVLELLHFCRQNGHHVTFRAAGTSLSGQAVTDGILVDLSRHWDGIEIVNGGAIVRLQPGVTGGRVNARLAPYGRKLGPDPASLNAAMIGGIAANNASGMCCGTALNTYHTMHSMAVLLADGTRIDTAKPDADQQLATQRPDLHAAVAKLRDDIRASPELVETIRRKYRIKNTMGYALNAFLDEDEPARIITRLMVGSEGTLGFIERIDYATVATPREQHTALFVYPTIHDACATVHLWRDLGAAAVELMDDASIRSFSSLPHTPEAYRLYQPGTAALLVEFHDTVPTIPDQAVAATTFSTPWYDDAEQRAVLWRLRKGIMPTVGALRPRGTTMINEDIAVPPEHLADLVVALQSVFSAEEFQDAVIFGHAKDGNLHFIINQDFSQPAEIQRYLRTMDRIAELVVDRFHGSLKAEHGTGRNMAPYVEREWGTIAYTMMRRLKDLLDPSSILNPDVLLSSDPEIHVKHLKPVPVIHEAVNDCIECGFCEPVCPTREHTTTPRQRIVLQRELQGKLPDHVARDVRRDLAWMSDESCAADGICATACPVGINTADLVRHHRQSATSSLQHYLAAQAAQHPVMVDTLARLGSAAAHRLAPQWPDALGTPDTAPNSEHPSAGPVDLIYAPACPSRWFGTNSHGVSISDQIRLLCDRAGVKIHQVSSGTWCCGQLYASKGLASAAEACKHTSEVHLTKLGLPEGTPIMTDVSSCAAASAAQHVISPLVVLEEMIIPRLRFHHRLKHVVLHPGCGVESMREGERMRRIAQHCAERVSIPASASCCGMAGDHGLRHPDLVRAALRQECSDLAALEAQFHVDAYVSLNPVCEAGLTRETDRSWISLWELVASVTSGTLGSSTSPVC